MTTPYFDSQASARTILSDEHLQPDLLLPAQWNARSRPIMEPEAKLIWAVFDAAWHELLRPKDRRAAEVWFAHPNYRNNSGFSLGEVCDYLNWDTDSVREAARTRVLAARDPAMPDDPIPTELACELLGVSANRVHDLARRGRLKATKDGGKRCWYSRREVETLRNGDVFSPKLSLRKHGSSMSESKGGLCETARDTPHNALRSFLSACICSFRPPESGEQGLFEGFTVAYKATQGHAQAVHFLVSPVRRVKNTLVLGAQALFHIGTPFAKGLENPVAQDAVTLSARIHDIDPQEITQLLAQLGNQLQSAQESARNDMVDRIRRQAAIIACGQASDGVRCDCHTENVYQGTDGLTTAYLPLSPSLRACGHPMSFANTYRRGCLICHRANSRRTSEEARRRERIARLE